MTTPQSLWIRRSELLVLAFGTGIRLARYLQQRPLWLDEAMLSLNILSRPPLTFHPLNDNQVAPLGFLWVEWMVTRVAGTGERALRFVPLVAAVAGLIAFSRLARRTLEPGVALLATALAALSPILIYYSAEVKSYEFDWLCAILMMHATLTLMESASRDAWVRWSLAAAFSALMSTAAPFYTGGCALALLAAPRLRTDWRTMPRVAAAGTPAALIFVFHLLTVYASSSTRSFMQHFWAETFLDPSVAGLNRAVTGIREFWSSSLFGAEVFASLPRKSFTMTCAAAVVGAIAIARRSVPTAVFLLAPVVFVGVASFTEHWPLTPRLLLFLVPTVLLTLTAGLAAVARLAPRSAFTPLVALLSVVVLAAALKGVPDALRWQNRFIDVPGVLREVDAHAPRNSTVYVTSNMVPACVYYLAWHPDRPEWAGDPFSQHCAVARVRTVLGTEPDSILRRRDRAGTSGPRLIAPEWTEREARRILAFPSPEIWLLMGRGDLMGAVPPRIEKSGVELSRDTLMGRIRVLTYRSR